ncbi:MAG: sugar phosphate isomerase/epimerase [Clostridia bacterium]|nr:sugar phosphate isomerase/epimerase [Clostridia bacterium]
MANFIFSAFADEYSSSFDEQLYGLKKLGIPLMEIRGVDGTNVSDLDAAAAKEIARKLEESGIGISAIGSPIGKIRITAQFEEHIEKLKRTIETAHILSSDRIRMFSFYMPHKTKDYSGYKDEVIERIGKMLDIAEAEGIRLFHENEKGIFGESPENCRIILDAFPDRLGCVFDPANFGQNRYEAYPHAYDILKDRIDYFHIKDVSESGDICPAGEGIGHIPEILADANKKDCTFILTLEPHLWDFAGLASLEEDAKSVIGRRFTDGKSAFEFGFASLSRIVSDL